MTGARSQEQHLDLEESPEDRLGDKHPHTLESLNNLIKLYEAWGKPEWFDRLTILSEVEGQAQEWRRPMSRSGGDE